MNKCEVSKFSGGTQCEVEPILIVRTNGLVNLRLCSGHIQEMIDGGNLINYQTRLIRTKTMWVT